MSSLLSSRGIIKDVAIIVICLVAAWFSLQAIFGTQNPFYVVSSGSMIPDLEIYDILVVSGNDPFGEVQIGDIIVFNRPSGHDRVIVHRVVAVTDEDPRTLRTKGDANPASIPGTDFPITDEEYIGSVVYVIPQAGYITRVLSPPVNYIIIAVIVGFMVTKHLYGKKKDEWKEGAGAGAEGSPGVAEDAREAGGVAEDAREAGSGGGGGGGVAEDEGAGLRGGAAREGGGDAEGRNPMQDKWDQGVRQGQDRASGRTGPAGGGC